MRPSKHKKRQFLLALFLSICATAWLAPAPKVGAADHGDAPFASLDRSADINDAYVFLDPNDNSKVVFAMTVNGFIVPAEASNFGISITMFSTDSRLKPPAIRYRSTSWTSLFHRSRHLLRLHKQRR
jgi:hypothetical protein